MLSIDDKHKWIFKGILILAWVIYFKTTLRINRYIRTSSSKYNSKLLDNKMIHLTNDAV